MNICIHNVYYTYCTKIMTGVPCVSPDRSVLLLYKPDPLWILE